MGGEVSKWIIARREAVIRPGQLSPRFDATRASAAHVIRIGENYRMIYWGSDSEGRNYILQAEAPLEEPNEWKPLGGPLIGPQPETEYNCVGPSFPFLLPLTQSHWLLYFTAWGRWAETGKISNTTGVAISEDGGRSWRYHDEHPMLPLDREYDREATGSLWVMAEGGRLRMYYTAIGEYYPRPAGVETGHGEIIPRIGIAYAESEDGIHWEKPLDDLVVQPRGFAVEPYEYICSKPCVVRGETGYVLWVNTFGTAYRVHRLLSQDGVHWTWGKRVGPDGELGTGEGGCFDDFQRSYPTIIRHENEWRCWYTGNGFGATGMGYAVSEAPV